MILCTESGSLHDLLYCMTFCIAYLFTITEQYYCVWCSQTFIISAVMCMVCAISCCCSVHWEQPLLSTAHTYQLHTRALWQGGAVTHSRYQYCIAGLLRKKNIAGLWLSVKVIHNYLGQGDRCYGDMVPLKFCTPSETKSLVIWYPGYQIIRQQIKARRVWQLSIKFLLIQVEKERHKVAMPICNSNDNIFHTLTHTLCSYD